MPADIIAENIDEMIQKFTYFVNEDNIYRIPLRHFCDLEKINYLKNRL